MERWSRGSVGGAWGKATKFKVHGTANQSVGEAARPSPPRASLRTTLRGRRRGRGRRAGQLLRASGRSPSGTRSRERRGARGEAVSQENVQDSPLWIELSRLPFASSVWTLLRVLHGHGWPWRDAVSGAPRRTPQRAGGGRHRSPPALRLVLKRRSRGGPAAGRRRSVRLVLAAKELTESALGGAQSDLQAGGQRRNPGMPGAPCQAPHAPSQG